MSTQHHSLHDEEGAWPHPQGIVFIVCCCASVVAGLLLGEGRTSTAHADFYGFHLPSIEVFRSHPWIQAVHDYPSATTPLFAMVGALIPWGDRVWVLRATYMALSVLLVYLFVWTLGQRFPQQKRTSWHFVAGGALLLSPYFRSQAFWPTTDNFALLFLVITAALMQKVKQLHEEEHPSALSYVLASLLPIVAFGAFYSRQTYAFLPAYVMLVLFRKLDKFRWCCLTGLIAALPALYLVLIWHGMTPPRFQEFHQGFAFGQISFPPAICAFFALPFFAAVPELIANSLKRSKLVIGSSLLLCIPFVIAGIAAFRRDFIYHYAGLFANGLAKLHTAGLLLYLAFTITGVLLLLGLQAVVSVETRFLIVGFLLPYLLTTIVVERYFNPIVMVTTLLFFDANVMKRFATLKAAYILAGFQLLLLAVSLLEHSEMITRWA